MVELQARSAANGLTQQYGDVQLSEVADHALVSLAYDHSDPHAIAQALHRHCKVDHLPSPGEWVTAQVADTSALLLGLQRDQLWLWWAHVEAAADHTLLQKIDTGRIALTDQSDGWAGFTLAGPSVVDVLERLCPLDLHIDRFSRTTVARTVMEHLSVILIRIDDQRFDCLTPRSSVDSFVHAVGTAAGHVAAERELRVNVEQ